MKDRWRSGRVGFVTFCRKIGYTRQIPSILSSTIGHGTQHTFQGGGLNGNGDARGSFFHVSKN